MKSRLEKQKKIIISALICSILFSCKKDNHSLLIEDALKGISMKNRQDACIMLGGYKDDKTINTLITLLNDELLYFCAARSLGKIGDKRAIGPLIKNLKTSSKKHLNTAAIWALGEIGDMNSLSFLTALDKRIKPTDDLAKHNKKEIKNAIEKIKKTSQTISQ